MAPDQGTPDRLQGSCPCGVTARHRGWDRRRNGDVPVRIRRPAAAPFWLQLQIVPGVREVEGLVAQREVGNDVLQHGVLEGRPVPERWTGDLDAVEAGRARRLDPVPERPPPGFDETDRVCTSGQRPQRRACGPARRALSGDGDESRGLRCLVEANHGPGPQDSVPTTQVVVEAQEGARFRALDFKTVTGGECYLMRGPRMGDVRRRH